MSADPSHVTRHLLLVEDEPGTMTTVALLLEMMGYRVSQAPNGRQALALLSAERPDLVVTDYMMPHVNGLELIQQIRADAALAGLPVILTSAALPPEIDVAGIAQGFVRKPYRIDTLTTLIEQLLAPPSG